MPLCPTPFSSLAEIHRGGLQWSTTRGRIETAACQESTPDPFLYFHQVIASYGETQPLRRFKDLPDALQFADTNPAESLGEEWRVHFHIPLHAPPWDGFQSTQDHLLGAMDWLSKNPTKCQHIEMETYTWEVLPPELRTGDVVDQLVREYDWTLAEMKQRGLVG